MAQHIVKKLFLNCSQNNKEKLAHAALACREKLSICKEGRGVMQAMQLDYLQRDEEGWLRGIQRQRKALEMLCELEAVGPNPIHTKVTSITSTPSITQREAPLDDVDNRKEQQSLQPQPHNRKRKRKHDKGKKMQSPDNVQSVSPQENVRLHESGSTASHRNSFAKSSKSIDLSLVRKLQKSGVKKDSFFKDAIQRLESEKTQRLIKN